MEKAGATEWTQLEYAAVGGTVYLDPRGPGADGPGWAFVPSPEPVANQTSMSAAQADDSGFRSNIPLLTWEYARGRGPVYRQFGPDQYMTKGMMTSPDVEIHRQNFSRISTPGLRKYGPGESTGHYGLGAEDGPFESLWDWNWPRQFVGGFTITITELPDGNALFEVDNTTHLQSLLYQIPGVKPVDRSTMRPLSNKYQTYWWIEKAPPRK